MRCVYARAAASLVLFNIPLRWRRYATVMHDADIGSPSYRAQACIVQHVGGSDPERQWRWCWYSWVAGTTAKTRRTTCCAKGYGTVTVRTAGLRLQPAGLVQRVAFWNDLQLRMALI